MRILCLGVLAVLSIGLQAAEYQGDMRGKSYEYQQGFRDGFNEAQRMMNGGGGNNWNNGNNGNNGNNQQDNRTIRIFQATYGSNAGTCDFTERLSRTVDGKDAYLFKPGNQWCGDPSNHVAKEARIEYSCGRGRSKNVTVPEGRTQYLRCD